MRFAHIADIHLGYEQYNQPWRAEDFARAFREVVEKAVAERVDFAVIAGDLFHRSTPSPRALKEAIEGLSVFKREGIPVFAVEGNHDRSSRDMSACQLLEKLGLLNVLGLRRERVENEHVTSERVGNVYVVRGYWKDVEILGDGYRTRWRIGKVLPLLKPSSDESILVMHQSVKEAVDIDLKIAHELTLSDLPEASYYAFGHVHVPKVKRFGDAYLVYPGCVERYDAREASKFVEYGEELRIKDGVAKGFVIVEDFEPRFVEVKTRNLVSLRVSGRSAAEVERKLVEAFKLVGSEDVAIVKLASAEDIDLKRLSSLLAKAKHFELRFERLSEEEVEFEEAPAESEFFSEFELRLLELLKEESEVAKSTAIDVIKEHFGLAVVKRLDDFDDKPEKRFEGKRVTLLDFLGGGDED
ncbi:MAG: exonuclease SbcCD subunit D [Archaeoglobaceae archaeon]